MAASVPIRVLVTKIGLDGHDRGAKVLATMLRDAGMEVVYLGVFQTPEHIVEAAIQEDVDVVGVSCLSGEHLALVPRVAALMKAHDLRDVVLVVGGVIPAEDIALLKEAGVHEVFPAGSRVAGVVEFIRRSVTPR